MRAGVLGANDGLLSTASLMAGVGAASSGRSAVLTAGFAGLFAGALSMAAGEYTSVSSQRDTELADLERERVELQATPEAEQAELAAIYRQRGLSASLADRVAAELSAGDALIHHARDELGLDPESLAEPWQAASVSSVSFAIGALVPVLTAFLVGSSARLPLLVITTLVGLGLLGWVGAKLGGAPRRRAAVRVLAGGAAAMGVTMAVGRIVGGAI